MTARAVLTIDADVSGLTRAFAGVRAQAKATTDGIAKDFMGRAGGAYRASAKVGETAAKQLTAVQVREAQRAVTDFVRSEQQKRRASELTAAKRAEVEKKATQVAREEAQKRGLTAEQEARLQVTTMQRLTTVYVTEERRRTAAAKREQRERDRATGHTAQGLARGVRAVGSGTLQVARDAHGMLQDARQRSATTQHTLNAAFYQAGVGGDEGAAMRAALQREVTSPTGRLRGLAMEDVASSLTQAQTQFSVLTGANRNERGANLQRQIELMSFARDTYQDPAEVLRVAGMLNQQGIRGGDQREVLRTLTGMAQAGSIELSTLTSTALGPLMGNIGRSVNAGMTPEARARAVRSTAAETMAVGEIAAAAGLTPRDSLNALAKLRTSLGSERTAGNLDTRLRASGHADLAEQLIERGPGGRASMREMSPVTLMSRLVSGFGGDTNAVTNLLSANGPGSPMILDSQQRRLLTAMSSQTGSGESIAQRVAGMEQAGLRFSETDVARGRESVLAEAQTQLVVEQEKNTLALTANTGGVNDLSNAVRSLQSSNPLLSLAAPTVGGLAARAAGGPLTLLAAGLTAGASNTLSALRGQTTGGEGLSTVERLQRVGNLANPFMNLLTASSDAVGAVANPGREGNLVTALLQRIASGVEQNRTVTATPHAINVATGNVAATRGQTPRPEDR